MRKKKVSWQPNDVFAIPLLNNHYAIGHVLDQRMVNTVRIALYKGTVSELESSNIDVLLNIDQLISLIEVTREQLDYGVWKVIANVAHSIAVENYANEQYRSNKWIGSIVYDAGLAEDFINAFHGLQLWDDWYDPNYLDKFLVSSNVKPSNLLYKTATGL